MSELVDDLDRELDENGEDIVMFRVGGRSISCRARIDAVTTEQIAAGIPATEFNVIISPTQPYATGFGLPAAGVTDKVIRTSVSQVPKAITFVDPKIIGGEVVRINMRIAG